ncbi:hypothetical protein O9G_000804 [Rozella allomycis CSF55]|uniref:Uncharacterized protein n=1 Tax=Rozella allomycis (strain CSF55) TaxID=988480 RepID=A0A075AW27_ROZAC|nr:hypothetical protein O9G_000804 [Rozella allomycis CSF55]|eukprot:EPZ32729.1 hypothetical protein O9G_000804 [Rozella allomycis CSF55]
MQSVNHLLNANQIDLSIHVACLLKNENQKLKIVSEIYNSHIHLIDEPLNNEFIEIYHQAKALYFISNNQPESAIDHLIKANCLEKAHEIILDLIPLFFIKQNFSLIKTWLNYPQLENVLNHNSKIFKLFIDKLDGLNVDAEIQKCLQNLSSANMPKLHFACIVKINQSMQSEFKTVSQKIKSIRDSTSE